MSESYPYIIQPEDIHTGITGIDQEHQILVNMLNIASEQLTDDCGRLSNEEIIRDLLSYALYHFDNEEALMLEYQYPTAEREKHVREHRDFSTSVAQLRLAANKGKRVTREELLNFLKAWFVKHISGTDKQLAIFLGKLDPSLSSKA
ncbi:MAG: hemerythrin family protein [Methylomonas sp.]|uniref:bacteriohemerythrin n=1 Tax=Methylomonas sp. TaxID=418 RepID=UPI0025F215A9|nr:hemerythrin family protein [Methylomonas sp.]MCK9605644.1 hemerythrin family protein [Methylomonas sp.]